MVALSFFLFFQGPGSDRFEKTYYNEEKGARETKQLEIFDPDLEVFPELTKVTVWEGTLNPGDWIYLPSATLHGGKCEHRHNIRTLI